MKKYRKLQALRVKRGYTLKTLAQKLGISKQYLWDIEDGRRTLSYKMAYRISIILEECTDKIFLDDHKR